MAMKQMESWILILVLIIMPHHQLCAKTGGSEVEVAAGDEYRPVVENEVVVMRRKVLAPFQVCLVCKCCVINNAAATTACMKMPCCFGIDCHLPNKPFGVCAFLPNTCNCASCT